MMLLAAILDLFNHNMKNNATFPTSDEHFPTKRTSLLGDRPAEARNVREPFVFFEGKHDSLSLPVPGNDRRVPANSLIHDSRQRRLGVLELDLPHIALRE
jgi:hypothetical protein